MKDVSEFDKVIRKALLQGTIDGIDLAFNTLEESLPLSIKSLRDALTEEMHSRLADLDNNT